MNGCIDIVDTLSNLTKQIKNYLKDAGFKDNLYEIETYENREYVRVYMSEQAVDYIIEDIEKSDWKRILEITKYEGTVCSAIFAFKF